MTCRFWNDLSPMLARLLLQGFSGRDHLSSVARLALEEPVSEGAGNELALDSLLTAWAGNPFDAGLIANFLARESADATDGGTLFPLLRHVLTRWNGSTAANLLDRINGGREECLGAVRELLDSDGNNPFHWYLAVDYARRYVEWAFLFDALEQYALPDFLAPLADMVRGNGLFGLGECHRAARCYERAALVAPLPELARRHASALLLAGDRDQAVSVLRTVVANRPWDVPALLSLYEVETGGDTALAQLPGRVSLMLYTWNKADDLAGTLAGLAASRLGDHWTVTVLDNGSTDHTPRILERFARIIGPERFRVLTLPVNVGAPVARNWLMTVPATAGSDWSVFLDDDVILPPDWLERLGAATVRYPAAGVWGCKVVDYLGPSMVQCAEQNLYWDPTLRREVLLAPLHVQERDFGQIDYLRPCTSVTGCVHLFRTPELLACGGFDLRFNPSQYDDLERDLRMNLAGNHAVYQGFLSVRHKRRSGALSDAGMAQAANAEGNLLKLKGKYSDEDFETMAVAMDRVLLEDLLEKRAALELD